jgi:nucleoside-diphosphate-sugar epimerase
MTGPVLLTGGSGFLGSHVAEALASRGMTVRALVRASSDVGHLSTVPGVALVRGSLDDPESLSAALTGVAGVIHCAGVIKARSPEGFVRGNVRGTANLLEAARGARVPPARFVHVSSLAAAGPSRDGRPRPPGEAPAPLTAYGRSKLEAESLVRAAASALHTVVIRPPVIHGPRDRETLALFKAVAWGILPLTGSPDAVVSMIWARDCAEACVAALGADVPSGSAFDVEDGAPETLGSIVGHIERAVGKRVRLRMPIPEPVLRAAALASEAAGWISGRAVMLTRDKVRELRAPHWVCDGGAAREALGWRPEVTFAEGARLSAAWYRSAGWL